MSFFILEKIVFYVPSIYNLSIAIVSKGAKFLKWILTNFDDEFLYIDLIPNG